MSDQHSKFSLGKSIGITTQTLGSLIMMAVLALTCFGKVFPVITEILEEGDALTRRVVPP